MVSLMSAASSDRCTVCSALMTADQYYCVECGTRRGKPRFTPPAKRAQVTVQTLPAAPSLPARLGGNAAAAVALVVVLLALGVGVLIGASGTQTVHVTVAGPAGSSSAGSGTAGSGATGSGTSATSGASGTTTAQAAPPKTSTANSNPFPSS